MVTFASTLYSSTLTGSGSVVNNGANPAYPRWTLTGPCRTVVLTNSDTGQFLAFDYEIGARGAVTIDCNPVRQTVTDQDGADLAAYVRVGSAFWGFAGSDTVPFTVKAEWTSALTSIVLAWAPS